MDAADYFERENPQWEKEGRCSMIKANQEWLDVMYSFRMYIQKDPSSQEENISHPPCPIKH